jgi:hypothetical protein
VTQQDPRVAPAVTGGRSPLRRRVDDVEAAIMTGLVIFFLVAAPVLAIVAGRLADGSSLREQRAERSWRPVTAVLDQNAAAGLIGLDGEWGASFVTAQWTAPDGAAETGLIAVPLNARAGQHTTVWVTRTGDITRPPLSRHEVADRVASAVLAVVTALAAALAIVAGVVRIVAGRRRMAGWARSWAAVAPRWSSHR